VDDGDDLGRARAVPARRVHRVTDERRAREPAAEAALEPRDRRGEELVRLRGEPFDGRHCAQHTSRYRRRVHVAVGLGLRDVHVEPLLALRDRGALDVLEVMIDDALDAPDETSKAEPPRRATWRRLGAKWPLVAHGTELGIAGADAPDAGYLD